jgi:hypothetical protein
MKMLYLVLFTIVQSEQIITNINVPRCRKCGDFTTSLSKFGTKDITNKISYTEYASRSNDKCKIEGKFEQEKNLQLKIIIHQFVSGLPNMLLTTSFVFYMTALIKIRDK